MVSERDRLIALARWMAKLQRENDRLDREERR
jgi:hypothetical protein